MNKGTTFIELIIYTAIVAALLTLLFQFYAVAVGHKEGELIRNELSLNGEMALTDVSREIKNASTIADPIVGTTAPALTLDTGVVYSVDGDNRLSKTDGVITAPITTDKVLVESLWFEHVGPSDSETTVIINLVLRAVQPIEGQIFTDTFRTAMTLRK